MKSLIRRKLEMAARVREFSRAHVGLEPGYGPALAALEERLTRAQALDARQCEVLKALSVARARRVEFRRVIQSRFRLPEAGLSNSAFLNTVKRLIGDAMVAEFEAFGDAMRTARQDHITAREDLEAICIDLMELVKLIGGITGYRFGSSREVMAEWHAAREIPRRPRSVDSGRASPQSDIRPAA
jgi:hypothetical protein